jgi:hypothetical protein
MKRAWVSALLDAVACNDLAAVEQALDEETEVDEITWAFELLCENHAQNPSVAAQVATRLIAALQDCYGLDSAEAQRLAIVHDRGEILRLLVPPLVVEHRAPAFVMAAAHDRVAMMQELWELSGCANVDGPELNGSEGENALRVAVEAEQLSAVKWLLQHGANVDLARRRGSGSAIEFAARCSNNVLLQCLREHSARSPSSLVWHAARAANFRNAQLLLARSPSASWPGLIQDILWAVSDGRDNIVRKTEEAIRLLRWLSTTHPAPACQCYGCKRGTWFNHSDPELPLTLAVRLDLVGLAQSLVELGAHTNMQDEPRWFGEVRAESVRRARCRELVRVFTSEDLVWMILLYLEGLAEARTCVCFSHLF